MLHKMRFLFRLLVIAAIVLVAIQFVPYGRDHENPQTVQELKWNTTQTRALAQDACFACHSNLTDWPWYTSIAPVSWLTQHDVEDGRATLNFSEWQRPQDANLEDVVAVLRDDEMPPIQYRLIHSEARLSDAQRQELERGIVASWTKDPPGKSGTSAWVVVRPEVGELRGTVGVPATRATASVPLRRVFGAAAGAIRGDARLAYPGGSVERSSAFRDEGSLPPGDTLGRNGPAPRDTSVSRVGHLTSSDALALERMGCVTPGMRRSRSRRPVAAVEHDPDVRSVVGRDVRRGRFRDGEGRSCGS